MATPGLKAVAILALLLIPLAGAGPDVFNFMKVNKWSWPVRWSAKVAGWRCGGVLWRVLWAGGFKPVPYPWKFNWYKLLISIRKPPFWQRWHCRVYVHLPPPWMLNLHGFPKCKCNPIF